MDSNVFIESFKGNENVRNILETLINIKAENKGELFITYHIYEEVIYILLKSFSRKGYWELKRNKVLVKNSMKNIKLYAEFIIKLCEFLPINEKLIFNSLQIIEKEGLLPNDAILLSACVNYNIPYLVSLDSDFKEVCSNYGINLIDSIEKWK